MRFTFTCILHGSPLVHAAVHARYTFVIGSSALFCCERYGWAAADFFGW